MKQLPRKDGVARSTTLAPFGCGRVRRATTWWRKLKFSVPRERLSKVKENLRLIKIVDFCRVSTIDFQGMAKLKLVAKDYEYLLLTEVDETIYQSLEKSQVLEISSVLGMV